MVGVGLHAVAGVMVGVGLHAVARVMVGVGLHAVARVMVDYGSPPQPCVTAWSLSLSRAREMLDWVSRFHIAIFCAGRWRSRCPARVHSA